MTSRNGGSSTALSRFGQQLTHRCLLCAVPTGSYFIRNTVEGQAIIKSMCAAMPIYRKHDWKDQQFIIDARKGHFGRFIQLTPQHFFNRRENFCVCLAVAHQSHQLALARV